MFELGDLCALIVHRADLVWLGLPLCGDDLGNLRLCGLGLAESRRGQLLELVGAVEDPGVGWPGRLLLGACAFVPDGTSCRHEDVLGDGVEGKWQR